MWKHAVCNKEYYLYTIDIKLHCFTILVCVMIIMARMEDASYCYDDDHKNNDDDNAVPSLVSVMIHG